MANEQLRSPPAVEQQQDADWSHLGLHPPEAHLNSISWRTSVCARCTHRPCIQHAMKTCNYADHMTMTIGKILESEMTNICKRSSLSSPGLLHLPHPSEGRLYPCQHLQPAGCHQHVKSAADAGSQAEASSPPVKVYTC